MSLLPNSHDGLSASDFKDAPHEVRQLVMTGRCMAHELEMAKTRPDLVEAWAHCMRELRGKAFYDSV